MGSAALGGCCGLTHLRRPDFLARDERGFSHARAERKKVPAIVFTDEHHVDSQTSDSHMLAYMFLL